MGRMSDLNDLPRSHDVTDPTTCAWPAQEIAAAEAPVTAGTDRYMRAAAHAVARAALRELRQGPRAGPRPAGSGAVDLDEPDGVGRHPRLTAVPGDAAGRSR